MKESDQSVDRKRMIENEGAVTVMRRDHRSGPLASLVVLDLTSFLAGPYGTQIMADLGARVIKIERQEGDFSRDLPPHIVKGNSAYFHSVNRNKESVVLDLKHPKGRQLFLELVSQADVVVENFRPGVMKRLGLDFPELLKVNPRIVLCSISGFGQHGPDHTRPAYDMIVQALSGSMSINGEPGRSPMRLGVPLGDLAAGLFGVIGILAALVERSDSGKGQHVDISMLDCQVSLLSYLAQYYLVAGEVPQPQGRGHVSIPTYRSFSAADGVDIVVTANTEAMWQALCKMLDLPELIDDERFRTNADRLRNRAQLWEKLEAAFLTRSSQEWLSCLAEYGIPAAPVNTVDRALALPQVKHREMVVTVEHEDGETMQMIGNPVKLSGNPAGTFSWPPDLGEHTRVILEEMLSLTPEEISALEDEGVVMNG